ncbi:Required for respiratory growth protein 9 [Cladobotryum mycophilum]|uniref:Required for respiratory growth protein 9, mitochondrial n=1 Tax=Cladobotryum mycophilum TaxID=491253 RepID=A0ABR0T1I9_9HYPO
MSCSCRAVPWRTFIRGLAQVHKLEASTVHPALQIRPAASRSGLPWASLRQSRGLQTSLCRSQDAAAAAAPAPERDDAQHVTEAAVAAGDGVESPPGATKTEESTLDERPKKRGRKPKAATEEATNKYALEKKGKKKSEATEATWPKAKRGRPPKDKSQKPAEADRSATAAKEHDAESPRPRREMWQIQKAALKEKFPEGWNPRKRLSPDALTGIRALNAQFPDVYTTEALANKFEMSPDAIRRILRSKWSPSAEEEQGREDRWFRRGLRVWEQRAALGVKPPKRWRMEGVARDPGYHEWSKKVSQREREWDEGEIRKYREYREKVKKREGGYEKKEGGYKRREGKYDRREGSYEKREESYEKRDGGYGKRDGDYEKREGGYGEKE